MMRMLKLLRLVVCVVCIAAFASGCGGGGGAGTTDPSATPGQTDAERIAAAREAIAGIVTTARNLAQTANSAAAAVGAHEDATAAQIANASVQAGAAQTALADVVAASGAASAATTPAAAESALADARAALNDLRTAQSAVAGIQSAVNAVAEARRQREANEVALTNNSSLIRHVRDNKLLSDAVLGAAGANLTAASIVVGAANNPGAISSGARTPCAEPCAEYPANGTGATATVGQRTVRLQGLVTSSTTPSLTGTGRLSHGFDLNNGATTFVNAYTDISQERRGARNQETADDAATPYDERYDYNLDADYLLAGIWLTVDTAALSNSRITAFAYGGQPTSNATPNFCGSNEGTSSGESTTASSGAITTRVCGDTTGFNLISTFVKDGQDFTATYRGDANGAYLAGGDTSYFTADVELTAEFRNPTGGTTDGTGSIVGEVTNIVAGGESMAGSIELQKQSLGDDIGGSDKFAAGSTVGVVDGKSFGGSWKGQFFGMTRRTRSQTTVTTGTAPTTTTIITTTYSPLAPGSVAGTFYATQQSAPAGDAAFIGSFAAHR